jgi:hypothetical protein
MILRSVIAAAILPLPGIVDRIGRRTLERLVAVLAAVNRILTRVAFQQVVPSLAEQLVVTATALDRVVTRRSRSVLSRSPA